jgi:hypothetical protein
MHTLSSHDMTRARPMLRQFNLLLLALLAGLLVGRSLPSVESGLGLSTQVFAEVGDAQAHRTTHPRQIPERIAAHGRRI